MLEIAKFLSIVSAAAFGIYGSIANFRDNNGRITVHGKFGVAGVLCSACIAGGIQIYSDMQSEKSTVTILKKNSEILTGISRSLHPLDGMTVEYLLEPDWTIEALSLVHDKIEESFDHRTSFGATFYEHDKKCFHALKHGICSVGVNLYFFTQRIDPVDFNYENALNAGELGEDLRISLPNPCSLSFTFSEPPQPIPLDYDLREGKLVRLQHEVPSQETKSNSRSWRGNGRILSVHDLLSSQLIIQLSSSGMPIESKLTRSELLELRASVSLKNLVIRLDNGIVMGFDEGNLTEHTGKYHHKFYALYFPESMSELIEDTHYDEFKILRSGGS